MRPDPRRRAAGFTLIELLVLIAVIAVLAALLMPAAAKVREQAKRVECAARLRGWGTAIFAWTAERHNLVPRTMGAVGLTNPQDMWIAPSPAHTAGDIDMTTLSGYMDSTPTITGLPLTAASTVSIPRDWRCPYWQPLQATVYASGDWWYTIPGYLYYGQFRIAGWSSADAVAYTDRQLEASRLLLTDWTYFYYAGGRVRQPHGGGQNQMFGDGRIVWRPFSAGETAVIAVGGISSPSVTNGTCRYYR